MTSQCDRILAALASGEWRSVAEIHAEAGYSRLNSRVSELRSRGFVIECDQAGEGERATDRFRYRLVGELTERAERTCGSGGMPSRPTQPANQFLPRSVSFPETESGQLMLVAA